MNKIDYIFKAEVIDNNDSEKKGRIKIKVLPFMEGITDNSLLPWSEPYFNCGSSDEFSHDPPIVGSKILVILKNGDWRKIKYINYEYIYGKYDYDSVKSKLDNITEKTTFTYPDPVFKLFKDGSVYFIDKVNGQLGIYHNSGSYSFIDSEGSIYNYSKKDIKFYNDNSSIELVKNGNLNIDASATYKAIISALGIDMLGASESFVKGDTLFAQLTTILTAIQTFATGLNPTNLSAQAATLATAMGTALGLLSQIKSTKIKGE